MRVADAVLDDDIDKNAVALWLGNRFHELAQKLRLPPAPLPARKFEVPEGRFFIGNPSKMFVYLEQWVARAFERFSKENDAELRAQIASLMQWTLPDHPESLAATWQVARDPERELQRQLQIFGRGKGAAFWKARLETAIRSHVDPFANVRIIAFIGMTGTHREDVARSFASELQRLHATAEFETFVTPIKRQLLHRLAARSIDKHLLMKAGQKAVEQSPLDLALSLSALRDKSRATSRIVVVDSVRHDSILQVLKWLEPKQLTMVNVYAKEEVRRRRIAERGQDPDELAKDPTEREIPLLSKQADQKINDEGNWTEDVRKLAREIVAA